MKFKLFILEIFQACNTIIQKKFDFNVLQSKYYYFIESSPVFEFPVKKPNLNINLKVDEVLLFKYLSMLQEQTENSEFSRA